MERERRSQTCFGVHGEVGLSLQDAVDHPGAVPVGGVVGVRGGDLDHSGTCGREGEASDQRPPLTLKREHTIDPPADRSALMSLSECIPGSGRLRPRGPREAH